MTAQYNSKEPSGGGGGWGKGGAHSIFQRNHPSLYSLYLLKENLNLKFYEHIVRALKKNELWATEFYPKWIEQV